MPLLIPALGGALVVAGIIGVTPRCLATSGVRLAQAIPSVGLTTGPDRSTWTSRFSCFWSHFRVKFSVIPPFAWRAPSASARTQLGPSAVVHDPSIPKIITAHHLRTGVRGWGLAGNA